MTKPLEAPWVIWVSDGVTVFAGPVEENRQGLLRGGRGEICEMDDLDGKGLARANARYMVRCVNSHAPLVAALQALGVKPDGYCFCHTPEDIAAGHTGECKQAVAALRKAGGLKP